MPRQGIFANTFSALGNSKLWGGRPELHEELQKEKSSRLVIYEWMRENLLCWTFENNKWALNRESKWKWKLFWSVERHSEWRENEGCYLLLSRYWTLSDKAHIRISWTWCEALRNIHCQNLIKILAACSSVDSRGNEFKVLDLEFLANGNLDNWLHPKNNNAHERKRPNHEPWLNIAIAVASASDHLVWFIVIWNRATFSRKTRSSTNIM